MIKLNNSFLPNEFLSNCNDTVFTMLVRESISKNDELKPLNNFTMAHGLLSYPQWNSNSDIFQYLSKEVISNLQQKKCFFVFDASTEGFSPINDFPFFDVLYFNCEKYDIDPSMIIYVSSNLKDENNILEYSKNKNKKPINVFSFISFEKVVRDPSLNLEEEKKQCVSQFEDKYFSSLSRVIRYYRSIATFLLCHSDIRDRALISHSSIEAHIDPEHWRQRHQLTDFSFKQVKRWFKSLPLTIDKTNFDHNWALDIDYYNIHRKTLFQVVNETLVDNYNNTSLFYSEKTFRPIACFQPLVIYGQKGCNKSLANIGYKTYDKWFDLSFDDESDNILRYKKLLSSITDTCRYLDSLSKEKQIEWRFQHEDILQHNFNTMCTSSYSMNKLKDFLRKLND